MELNAEDLSNLRKLFQMRTLNETVGMAAIRPAQAESLMKMAAAGLVTYRTVNYEEEKQKARVERLKLSYEQHQQAEALERLGEMSLKSLSITIPENYNLYFITAEGVAEYASHEELATRDELVNAIDKIAAAIANHKD